MKYLILIISLVLFAPAVYAYDSQINSHYNTYTSPDSFDNPSSHYNQYSTEGLSNSQFSPKPIPVQEHDYKPYIPVIERGPAGVKQARTSREKGFLESGPSRNYAPIFFFLLALSVLGVGLTVYVVFNIFKSNPAPPTQKEAQHEVGNYNSLFKPDRLHDRRA